MVLVFRPQPDHRCNPEAAVGSRNCRRASCAAALDGRPLVAPCDMGNLLPRPVVLARDMTRLAQLGHTKLRKLCFPHGCYLAKSALISASLFPEQSLRPLRQLKDGRQHLPSTSQETTRAASVAGCCPTLTITVYARRHADTSVFSGPACRAW